MRNIAEISNHLDLGIDLVAALEMAVADTPPEMQSPLRSLAELALAELRMARDEVNALAEGRRKAAALQAR